MGIQATLKWVVLLTVGLTLFAALFDVLFPKAGLPSPFHLFGLSRWGITHGFIWQFLTNFFLLPSAGGVSFPLLINLFFTSYMVWVMGNAVVSMKSVRDFLWLYLGGGLIASLIGGAILLFAPSAHCIAGTTPALYALMMGWLILCPDVQILLFFVVPVRVKWLIVGIIGIHFLVDLSHGLLLDCLTLSGAVLFSYIYCLICWSTHSPFLFLHPFERWVFGLVGGQKKKRVYADAKVIDFKTGRAVFDDESFADYCLDKITREGRGSLTVKERFRLWRLSRRKRSRF